MCDFIDCFAEHVLGDQFESRWPENPELRNKVYIDSILSLTSTETNIFFIVYDPKSHRFGVYEKDEVKDLVNEKVFELIGPLIMNPQVSTYFYNEPNKWLGSTSGIGSFFPFIFKMPSPSSKKSLEETADTKIKETIKSLKEYNATEFSNLFNDETFKNNLKNEIPNQLEKRKSELEEVLKKVDKKSSEYKTLEKKLKAIPYILILFENRDPYENYLESEKLLEISITSGSKSVGRCQICGNEGNVGYPVIGSSYDSKKEFLTSPTKGKGRISVCATCGFKINAFDKLLQKFKLMPVFIDKSVTEMEARNIRIYIKDSDWYSKFMTNVYETLHENEYKMAHYIMIAVAKDLIWVDYVSSLRWTIKWKSLNLLKNNLELEIKEETKNRKEIESVFYSSMKKGMEKTKSLPFSLYFDNQKEKEGRKYEDYLFYKYRDYLYRFTYKNEYPFSKEELIEFVNYAIAQKYYDVLREKWPVLTFGRSIIAPLEIFFNIPNLIDGEKMKGLEELRKKLDDLLEKDSVELDDAEWAYCAGAFYRYLISKSKAKESPLYLEPLINAGTIKEVVDILTRTFEKYQHEILQTYLIKWGNISASAFIPINKDKSFEELKPFFYAGFVDLYAINKFYGN